MKDLDWLRNLPGSPTVVAELKTRSPYGWFNPHSLELSLQRCHRVGDILSVHTDPLWGGSFHHLQVMVRQTKLPVLAKGFHPTVAHVARAFEAGATYCLTVGWWPGGELGKRCWHECETLEELSLSPAHYRVWNRRNPRTGETRPQRPDEVAHAQAAGGQWLCLASKIRGPEDVNVPCQAVLIGEGLYE
jgi:hypothetical protein